MLEQLLTLVVNELEMSGRSVSRRKRTVNGVMKLPAIVVVPN